MLLKIFSLFSFGLGVFVLVQVTMPYVGFWIWQASFYNDNTLLIDPRPTDGSVLGVSIEEHGNFPAFVSHNVSVTTPPYTDFNLTIPKIDLKDAHVVVNTNDFDQNLAHMPGTALPGDKGNVFITGHSSLQQLFRPDNYKAIFANLPKIGKGDQIIIDAGGNHYEYVVEGLKIVDPKAVWVVNPPDSNGRYLSLMTCVPPGFNTQRLIVLARLKV